MKARLHQHPRLNCFNKRWTGSWFVIAAAALALTAHNAFGMPDFVSRIPNGNIFGCSTCHVSTSPVVFNPFGRDFNINNRVWNATLAGLDSDGDGLTNGQELGDPNGTGTPTPAAPVSNPGDPHSNASNPIPPRPPSSIIRDFGILTLVTGLNPEAPLVQGPDGTLYGTTAQGDGYGTVFRIQPDGTGFAVLKYFTNSVEGRNPWTGLVLSGGTLYGTTESGGSSGKGTVFRVVTDGTGYAVLKNFTDSEGAGHAALVLSGGILYGTTWSINCDSSNGNGVVYKMNTDGTGYTVLKRFTNNDGPKGGGLVMSGGTLYGTTFGSSGSGGSSTSPGCKGTVFTMNTDGTGYAVLKRFTGTDGQYPYAPSASCLVLSGGTLYGTTYMGGSSGKGTVFRVNTDGTGFAVLKNFTGPDGQSPYAGLVSAGGALYGTTYSGGSSGDGTVFKMNTDGTGFAVLKSFTGSDGSAPQAGLVLSGGTLYGTTYSGGSSGKGTVFEVNTDGTGFAVLKTFTGSDGQSPYAGLALSGGTLYGTTYIGGSSGKGTVFKVKTDGTGSAVLKSFTGSDGSEPYAGLVLSGGTLYGTTSYGGSSGKGTVFKVNTDGTGFAVLQSFTGSDGSEPYAGLALSGGTLYGTTWFGGSCGYGTVFMVNTDGTGFAVLKDFTDSDGKWPYAGLVLSGGTLYGTTAYGGNLNNGTVFRIDLPPTVLTADGSGSFITNGFGFNLSGMAGQTVVIEASTDLTSWSPLLTNSVPTGNFHFNDPVSTNFAQRFYRVRLAP